MKVLRLDLHYLLPDDFEGTYEDAILNYLQYRKECGYGKNVAAPIKENFILDALNKIQEPTREERWMAFQLMLCHTEHKSLVEASMGKWDEEAGKWINLMEDGPEWKDS